MDLRPSLVSAKYAFGQPATVVFPDGSTVKTTAIWLPQHTVPEPPGLNIRKAEHVQQVALPRVDVAQAPLGTVIWTVGSPGADETSWIADGTTRVDDDFIFVDVVAG